MCVALWDVATGARRPDPPMPAGPNQRILGLSFSPDSRFLAVQTAWTGGWLWDLSTDPPGLVQLTPVGPPPPLQLSGLPLLTPNGLALSLAGPRELALFDPATRERRQTFHLRNEHIRSGEDARFSPDGRTLLVSYLARTWISRLHLPDRVVLWLRQTGYVSDHQTVVTAFDVATGRPRRSVTFSFLPSVTFPAPPHSFGADGHSFWTVTMPIKLAPGPIVFERWSVDPPGPPWWLIGLTAVAVGVAAVDWARSRRKEA
jgi:WD40 repeat protein